MKKLLPYLSLAAFGFCGFAALDLLDLNEGVAICASMAACNLAIYFKPL